MSERERERESVCVCVCVCEREREREKPGVTHGISILSLTFVAFMKNEYSRATL